MHAMCCMFARITNLVCVCMAAGLGARLTLPDHALYMPLACFKAQITSLTYFTRPTYLVLLRLDPPLQLAQKLDFLLESSTEFGA